MLTGQFIQHGKRGEGSIRDERLDVSVISERLLVTVLRTACQEIACKVAQKGSFKSRLQLDSIIVYESLFIFLFSHVFDAAALPHSEAL